MDGGKPCYFRSDEAGHLKSHPRQAIFGGPGGDDLVFILPRIAACDSGSL